MANNIEELNETVINNNNNYLINVNNNIKEIIEDEIPKNEKLLYKLLRMDEFLKHKINFFNFHRPLFKYMNFIAEESNNLKFILIVDDMKIIQNI